MVIYQLFVRVFGATEKKKCGSLNDINDAVVKRLVDVSYFNHNIILFSAAGRPPIGALSW